jgi:sugar lactone lactonase YvrE
MNPRCRWTARLIAGILLPTAAVQPTLAQDYEWTTFAGGTGGPGFQDGNPGIASFNRPVAVAADAHGNLYLADHGNHTIRKISSTGMVSTIAGTGGLPGVLDGPGQDARFNLPSGLAVDAAGGIYVSDTGNHTIRRISPSGNVSTIAGLAGVPGLIDGEAAAARFHTPTGLALAPDGSIVVADTGNHSIRRIDPEGKVTTLAGVSGLPGHADGLPETARFNSPSALAIDGNGAIYLTDTDNCLIRKISPQGDVTTHAGTLLGYDHVDGIGTAAGFAYPTGIAVDAGGNVYVADAGSVTIRRIDASDLMVTTLAGELWELGYIDGNPGRFANPSGMAIAGDGTLLVADSDNHALRSVTADGVVGTVAASPARQPGDVDGAGGNARFRSPFDLAADATATVFVADTGNRTVRRISPNGDVSTLAGTALTTGTTDGNGATARFTSPRAITTGAGGLVHVADVVNTRESTIRNITPEGEVTTLAGAPGSLPLNETLYFLSGLATDAAGNVYGSDLSAIRKITPGGLVTFFAAQKRFITYFNGGQYVMSWRSGSEDGTGSAATFLYPSGVAADTRGNLFVTESGGCVIRKVSPTAVVTTIAGKAISASGTPEYRDGTGAEARFNKPEGIAVDGAGNLYVADTGSHTIRKVSPAGVVTTIGGLPGYAGAGNGIGNRALFSQPSGVAVDAMGNVYVADRANHRIVKGTPLGFPEILVQRTDGRYLEIGDPGLAFGSVPPGSVSSPLILFIWNAGSAPLEITAATLVGEQSAKFGIDRTGLPGMLLPGGGGVIRITAKPDALGPIQAVLRISSNDADESVFDVNLGATGNRIPVFAGYSASSPSAATVNIPLVKLLASAHDPDGDAISVTAVAWPSKSLGTLALLPDSIQFTPHAHDTSGTSTFLVTITDTRGGSVTGNVAVTRQTSDASGSQSMANNPPKLTMLPDGMANVAFHGIPGRSYLIQRSVNLTTWQNLGTVTADATGNIIHTDPAPPKPNAYYRIALP